MIRLTAIAVAAFAITALPTKSTIAGLLEPPSSSLRVVTFVVDDGARVSRHTRIE
jgi:hypothetical protein